jgi:hypothetical protein
MLIRNFGPLVFRCIHPQSCHSCLLHPHEYLLLCSGGYRSGKLGLYMACSDLENNTANADAICLRSSFVREMVVGWFSACHWHIIGHSTTIFRTSVGLLAHRPCINAGSIMGRREKVLCTNDSWASSTSIRPGVAAEYQRVLI